jgi:hypothetical protein
VRVTLEQYLMGREKLAPIDETMVKEAAVLLFRLDGLLAECPGIPAEGNLVSSGYRPPSVNAQMGGSKKSAHMLCMAIDLVDPKGELGAFLKANQGLLVKYNLWLEDPAYTVGWTHLQTRPTTRRVFIP